LKKFEFITFLSVFTLVAVLGSFVLSNGINEKKLANNQQAIQSIPESSASAVTSPPQNMEGINIHTEVFGTGADPDIITFGPKEGGCSGCPPYPNKISMEFELNHGTPVLAPLDMTLIGFDNRNAEYRLRSDGEVQSPYNDLQLWFESASPNWPNMIISVYHLSSSSLLLGHNQNAACSEVEEWQGTVQAQGHLFFSHHDYQISSKASASSCDALIGHLVKRGEVIGYVGSVGNHSMASFSFKVQHTEENPTVERGNRFLHWVQPGSFFYWKCYNPDAFFPNGVLAYPFPCDDYPLPSEQYDENFKYIR
jgi:hypothetical protein